MGEINSFNRKTYECFSHAKKKISSLSNELIAFFFRTKLKYDAEKRWAKIREGKKWWKNEGCSVEKRLEGEADESCE